MRNELYDFINDFNNVYFDGGYRGFPVDVIEEKNGYKVIASMPGMKKENIQASFKDGILEIKARFDKETLEKNKEKKYLIHERSYQKMQRSINFGDINVEDFEAKYENGILQITITTKTNTNKALSIDIK
jgi:HSP20 family protein